MCSAGFQCSAQPRCGQRGAVGVSHPVNACAALTASCGRSMVREPNSDLYLFSLSVSISDISIAAAMHPVIPHLLKPVATYISLHAGEYFPIYGIPSSVMQSCVAHRVTVTEPGKYFPASRSRASNPRAASAYDEAVVGIAQ